MSYLHHARRCRDSLTAAAFLVSSALSLPGYADYPERPLRFIVPHGELDFELRLVMLLEQRHRT